MSDAYIGWSDYETQSVHFWLNKDRIARSYWVAMAGDCWREATETPLSARSESARRLLAERLEDTILDGIPLETSSLYLDILKANLQEVSWADVADAFLQSVYGYKPLNAVAK